MSRIIAISNPKGGVGKTTTSINLAASLAIAEKSVLIVDLDPIGSVSTGLGFSDETIKSGVYEMFLGTSDGTDSILPTALPNLDIIPGNIITPEQEIRLSQIAKNRIALKRKLNDLIEKRNLRYDYILIDTPPSLSDLTIAALYACNGVLIPIQCGYYALKVVTRLLQLVNRIKHGANPDLKVEGILLNFYEKSTRVSQRSVSEARKIFRNLVFDTVIPKNTILGLAAFENKPAVLLDACASGSRAYLALAQEILEKNGFFSRRSRQPGTFQFDIDGANPQYHYY